MELLKFQQGNSKLPKEVWTFSLPAGWTCPGAHGCLAKANPENGTITDGKDAEVRCHMASAEARFPSVREHHWHNFQLLQGLNQKEMTELILLSLSDLAGIVRPMTSGDFFSQEFFDAWLDVARARPWTRFYFYTKSIKFWVRRIAAVGDGHTPGFLLNVVPTASILGRYDKLALKHGLRTARIVYTKEAAHRLGLLIDHDDRMAMFHGPDFALLLHGTQPSGSEASAALSELKKQGWNGYRDKRKPLPVVEGTL